MPSGSNQEAGPTPSIQLNLVVIRSADIECSAEFYSRLGLNFIKHSHGNGPAHYACESGTVVFEIYPRKGETDSTIAARIGFQVASLDVLVAKLEKHGAPIISSPQDSLWGRRAVVSDPDGHRVELTERSQ
jgi:catechol 2,3-dioxygenase-like lactoylglutathione lyase family enzyme